ncbi:MAG: GNAT family N-acetyltransferase [Pseudomonadota bacterium]
MDDITIRRTEPDDAAAIREIFDHESVSSQTLQLPHPALALWQKRLSDIPENVYSYVAECDSHVVGNISVIVEPRARRRHVASIGMVVKQECSGRGIGTRLLGTATDLCDNWLGIRRIELTVFTDNERAIALYRRFNFGVEGEARGFAMRDGEYANVFYMARLHSPVE